MENFQNENLKTQEIFELAKQFEVEELEERVEFGKWTASAEAGANQKEGAYVKAGISKTF
ncbi:hypothetical protein ABWH96_04455 [Marivirga tractuosa]|uniref:hypothetical protein n=1 Tax=Marivirga tractuosa TaxID=1006 RepID=UPI0035D082FB